MQPLDGFIRQMGFLVFLPHLQNYAITPMGRALVLFLCCNPAVLTSA